jgi:hypothetical protein
MTDRFEATARAVAELSGLTDYPFAVIGHPIANDGDDDLRRKADAVVARIAALLTERPAAAPGPRRGIEERPRRGAAN